MSQRSKIDLYGLLDRVLKLHSGEEDGKPRTIEEIEEILRSEGYDISRESIRRKLKSSREVAEVYSKSLEEAKVLLDAVRNNPNTDVVEVTNSLLAHRLFEFAKSVDELHFEEPEKFVIAVERLANAQVKVARLRLDFQKGFESARKEIIGALARELDRMPEVRDRLLGAIQAIEVRQ